MPTSQVDLARLFKTVAVTLDENKDSLNEADAYNHDHGDNMVNTFKTISQAMAKKQGATPSEQLEYASKQVLRRQKSGSAQMYSQGLAQAASRLQGQPTVNAQNAMTLVQALLGGGQQAAQPTQAMPGDSMGGLLGALLGGQQTAQPTQATPDDSMGGLLGALLGGGQAEQPAQPAQSQQPDMMSGLLGALLGGGTEASQAQAAPASQGAGGIDLNSLLAAGMAYLQTTQQGGSTMQALVNAVMAGSQMNNTPHHAQSGNLVASTLINTLSSMLGGRQ